MKADDVSISAIKFAMWMDAQAKTPSPEAVAAHMRCSRATAYRWLQRWRLAKGETT